MRVTLAGYNVDTDVLKEIERKTGKREDLTPEVLSAAYARISRDPRDIDEIRKEARTEVEKTRRSNSTIIFKMGHHSVAEHAVFNLDIIGVSRLAMEELEKFRLCSYTEKSQRYITLDNDYVMPKELKGTSLEQEFIDVINLQNEAYFKLFENLKKHIFEKHADLSKDPKNHNLLEGWAKEDARYITALATESQVGHTINGRNLELLLRRFASNPLSEVQELGRAIYGQISGVAPSIVIFHQANDRDLKTYPELKDLSREIVKKYGNKKITDRVNEVELSEFTPNGDELVAAAILHTSTALSYEQCKEIVQKMSIKDKKNIFSSSWRNMQLYDSMIREFEYVNLTFDIVLSSACFGQLKRHRMSTITAQEYDPGLGNTIPQNIKEIGMESYFMGIVDKTNKVYEKIKEVIPLAAPYVLTNSHRKRVLMRANAREVYHVSRLREDAHAQWDVQNISRRMVEEAKKVMPLTFEFAGGKDRFKEIYKSVFGEDPKVAEVALPGARKIK
ncbi:MAG: FAD-dependent thymidylate synthase [Candidatus Omnitrophica bacterium]|nr:FAD-dependent thymidylate synthase [Candidatus Omnitrophota bacterium]